MLDRHWLIADPQQQPQALDDLSPANSAYRGSDAVACLKQPFCHQNSHGFPHYCTAHAELFGELPFRGQFCANGQAPSEDLALDRPNDPIDEAVFVAQDSEPGRRAFLDQSFQTHI